MLGATFLFYMPRYTHLILLILEILVMKMSKFCSPSLTLQKPPIYRRLSMVVTSCHKSLK